MTDPFAPKDLLAHGVQTQAAPFDPVGAHTRNATLGTVVDLSATRPAGADKIMIQAEGQNVRYTLDGTTPTVTVGFLLLNGTAAIVIECSDTTSIQILESAVGGVVNYIWGT
jgi:hypothetical protein